MPNFAFADHPGPFQIVISSLFLYPFPFLSLAVVYVVIRLLKSFKPSLGNYIHSNRILKIGLYFSAWGITWTIPLIIVPVLFDRTFYSSEIVYVFLFLVAIPGIILILIGILKKHFGLKKALVGISTGIIALIIILVINYEPPRDTLSETIIVDNLKILGYDARDLNELKAHDRITMLKNSAGIQNNAIEKGERIAIYLQNQGIQPATIIKVKFGGTDYNFEENVQVIDNYDGTAPSQGNYVILTDGASGLLQSSGELQPGRTVTVVLDLADQFVIGRDVQFRYDTSIGNVFVGTITIGQQDSL